MKYIKISIVILLVSFISIFAYKLTTNNSTNKLSLTKEQMKEMLSYTIDGNKTSSMPTKGSGYKVKSITCKNGSILSWDNDNWLLEVEKVESEDLCNIDFTKNETLYNVKLIPTISKSFDSTSKTTTKNGTTTFYTNLKIKNITGCDSEILKGKVVVKNVTSNTTCNVEITKNIYNMLLINNPIIKTRTDFNSAFSETNTETLFKAQEDNTDVYYFAGDARNNWVKFGTWKEDKKIIIGHSSSDFIYTFNDLISCNSNTYYNNDCKEVVLAKKGEDMYWRIIRTDKDGGVKLLYSGTSVDSVTALISTSMFNPTSNDTHHVGYMYGTSGSLENNRTNENNSLIKEVIDNWYKNNLIEYTKYLSSSAVYCNDRGVSGESNYSTTNSFSYDGFNRIQGLEVEQLKPFSAKVQPSYKCNNKFDSFSVRNDNAKLVYPIGLMTVDETVYAGALYGKSSLIWYGYNSLLEDNLSIDKKSSIEWWTMSPYYQKNDNNYIHNYVYSITNYTGKHKGVLGFGSYLTYPQAVRPVITLNGESLWKSGDGRAESPYEIVMN